MNEVPMWRRLLCRINWPRHSWCWNSKHTWGSTCKCGNPDQECQHYEPDCPCPCCVPVAASGRDLKKFPISVDEKLITSIDTGTMTAPAAGCPCPAGDADCARSTDTDGHPPGDCNDPDCGATYHD